MQRPECQYFRKERYPTNEDETHFEIIPWCDCNGRPDHTDHAKLKDRIDLLETALGMLLDWDGDTESVPEYVRKVLKG